MIADMDLQMMIVRQLQPARLAETDARRLTRHALRPPARDARPHVTHGLAASYARAVPFAGVELIEQRGRS
jgi:hypothetical protein